MTGCNYPQTRDSAVEKREQRKAGENWCARLYLCISADVCVCVCVCVCVRERACAAGSLTQHIDMGPQRRLALLLPNPV